MSKTNREQFEAWFENDVAGAAVTFPAFEDGEYVEGEVYDDQLYLMLQAMWMAWLAATKASEAQLTALTSQLESVVAENWNMRDVLRQLIAARPGGCYFIKWEPLIFKALNETPVTSAFLAEVRASAVEECAEHLLSNDDIGVDSEYLIIRQFAAQLRQGGAV